MKAALKKWFSVLQEYNLKGVCAGRWQGENRCPSQHTPPTPLPPSISVHSPASSYHSPLTYFFPESCEHSLTLLPIFPYSLKQFQSGGMCLVRWGSLVRGHVWPAAIDNCSLLQGTNLIDFLLYNFLVYNYFGILESLSMCRWLGGWRRN